jgi:hypothetical protein
MLLAAEVTHQTPLVARTVTDINTWKKRPSAIPTQAFVTGVTNQRQAHPIFT